MKFNKDTMMKIAIVAAVAIILYLLFKPSKCASKAGYAQYVPGDDSYSDGGSDDGGDGDGMENYTTLMESTLDDDEANGMLEPGA
jgi:hypothetical protein